MNADQEKQSELQKMLALKRHEAPPPRFFKGFSDKVIDRLHVPEPQVGGPWWQRLDLGSKPVLVSVSAVIVFGCLAAGMVAAMRVDPPKPAPRSPDDQSHLVVAPSPNALAEPAPQLNRTVGEQKLRIGDPMVVSEPSAFGQLQVQPASLPAATQTISNRNSRNDAK